MMGKTDRLRYAKIAEGEVVPGYEADNKDYVSLSSRRADSYSSSRLFPFQKQPVEALFRCLSLVLLDNASAEFTFLVRFFSTPPETVSPAGASSSSSPHAQPISLSTTDLSLQHARYVDSPASKYERKDSTWSMASASQSVEWSPICAPSPLRPADSVSEAGDEPAKIGRPRSTLVTGSPISRPATRGVRQASVLSFRNGSAVGSPASLAGPTYPRGELSRDSKKEIEALWHQVFDPALEYCEVGPRPRSRTFGRGMLIVFWEQRRSTNRSQNQSRHHQRYRY